MVEYEVKDGVIRINAKRWAIEPSIEDSEACMGIVVNILKEVKAPEKLIISEIRDREYDYSQLKLLIEIVNAQRKILEEEKLLSVEKFGPPECETIFPGRLAELTFLVTEVLRKDPIRAYFTISRKIKEITARLEKGTPAYKRCATYYLKNVLEPMERILSRCEIIAYAKPFLPTYKIGDRTIYRELFHPTIRPPFMLTSFKLLPPREAILVERYNIGDIAVEIWRIPGGIRDFYYIIPPEFKLPPEKYSILDVAYHTLVGRRPPEEIAEPERAREIFFETGVEIVKDLAERMGIKLSKAEIEDLAKILVRYTAGFGVLELLLADEKIQDVYINSPIGTTPIYVVHSDFEECETNLIPSKEDAEAWATRFRLYSGRPLDEANPVLDTELAVPGGRARVCAITRPLSPLGLAFAFRRHRERPWTFPLFIKAKMIDPLFAGLMNFIVQGGRSILVAGGRGSGKTSFLNSLMLEILRKYRIIVIEDSVTGDCEVIIRRNGTIEKTQIGKLVDELIRKYGCNLFNNREILEFNPENIEVFSVSKNGNVVFSKVKSFIRHKTNKPIYEIRTRTGRKIKVTGDHSLFSLSDDGELKEVKVSNLKVGDYIAVPRKLPINNEGIKSINLLNYLDKLNGTYVIGKALGKLIRENKKLVKEVSKRLNYPVDKGHTYPTIVGHWQRKAILPASVLSEILKMGCEIDSNELKIKGKGCSKILPIKIELDKDFLTFVGLWLADGSYDKSSIIISVVDEDIRDVVERVGKKFGISVKMHSDGVSLMLNSRILKQIMSEVLELKGNAYTKRIPSWVYNLSKEQIAYFLSGIFSGDGYLSKYEVAINLSSLELIKDIQTLLLFFGIIGRINKMNEKDKTFSLRISSVKMLKEFYSQIGFLQESRMQELMKMCSRKIHDVTDIIPLSLNLKEKIAEVLPTFNKYDYIKRGRNIGRQKLMGLLADISNSNDSEIYEVIKNLVYSDIFWDEIESIKVFEGENYVYDISVPNQENFICENIVAHNTLELAVDPMRRLGYNIERMKTRSVITRIEAELPPEEALRTGLRLGESVLIVGEVRGAEALALFEAMRIGALANVVAGTVHAESPYGVYDRIVHDLGVPPTSFKACDLIVICSMLRSPDGLHRFRRVVELTEVRKHWKEDPEAEGGFVPLMQYSAKEDRLKPTDVLVDGESWVLNEIAKKVREWHGAWDLVWDNILLRAKIKETMVDFALKLNRPEILEADWNVEANEMFHLICDKVREEVGSLDSKLIYERWLEWFKRRLR